MWLKRAVSLFNIAWASFLMYKIDGEDGSVSKVVAMVALTLLLMAVIGAWYRWEAEHKDRRSEGNGAEPLGGHEA